MDSDIKPIMARYCEHWKLDRKLANQLSDFVKMFINLNDDHVAFFGSNLTGVHRVRFTTTERFELTENILAIDETAITRDVKALDHIGSTWVRGTDGVNLALLYLVHLLANDNKLSSKMRYDMQVNALLILQYKFLSSIITAYFKYQISEDVALAVYNSLSGKYLIRRYGTWQALLLARCHNILVEEDTHKPTIRAFNDDNKIQYMITDIQGRLKSMILNIYAVTMQIKEQDGSIGSSNAMIELDGDITVRDISRKQTDCLTYIKKVIPDERGFIKSELVEIIYNSVTTMPRKLFVDVLKHASNDASRHTSNTMVLADEIIIHFFQYISENPSSVNDLKDYSNIVKTFKDLYTAGKSKNASVLKSRKLADKLVSKGCKTKNPATKAGLRIGLILYILLRTLTKDHYG